MKYLRLILLLTSFAGIAQNSPDTISSLKNISFEAIKDSLDLMQDRTDKRFFEGKYDSVILTSIDNIRFAEQIGDTEAAYYSRYMMGAAFIYLKDFKSTKIAYYNEIQALKTPIAVLKKFSSTRGGRK